MGSRSRRREMKEKKWKAMKINKITKIRIMIGHFYSKLNAINAIGKARSTDPKSEFEYYIESRF